MWLTLFYFIRWNNYILLRVHIWFICVSFRSYSLVYFIRVLYLNFRWIWHFVVYIKSTQRSIKQSKTKKFNPNRRCLCVGFFFLSLFSFTVPVSSIAYVKTTFNSNSNIYSVLSYTYTFINSFFYAIHQQCSYSHIA